MNDRNCPFCGAPITSDARFCTTCGKSFENAPSQTTVSDSDDAKASFNRTGVFRAYFGFKGRIGRIEWLRRCVTILGALIAFGFVAMFGLDFLFATDSFSGDDLGTGLFFAVYSFVEIPVLLWSWFAITAQRIHDFGKLGTWLFILPASFLILWVILFLISPDSADGIEIVTLCVMCACVLVFALAPGSRQENRFGAPREPGKSIVRRCFDFKGRASAVELRKTFVSVVTFGIVAFFVLDFVLPKIDDLVLKIIKIQDPLELFDKFFTPFWFTITFTPALAVAVRRLHDLGKSGKAFVIVGIVLEAIYLGTVVFIYALYQPSADPDVLNVCQFTIWGVLLFLFVLAYGFRRGDSGTNLFGEPPTK